MTCENCGAQTPNRRCAGCRSLDRMGAVEEADDPECPTCGGRTSGFGVECADCRRGDGLRADGGRAVHPGDTGLAHRGVGDQQHCPHGDAACARGEVPCWPCLTEADDE